MYMITLPETQVTKFFVDEIAMLPQMEAAALAVQCAQDACKPDSACVVLHIQGADISVAHLPRAVWAQLLAAVPKGAAVGVRSGGEAKQVRLTIEDFVGGCARFDRESLAALVDPQEVSIVVSA